MKIIKILAISFCIIIVLSQNVFALQEIISTGESWMDIGYDYAGIGLDTSELKTKSSSVYNLLLAIATIVAVIVGAILGVQYMMAGIDKKVEVKESLFPYFISCIVIFGSLGIWKLVVTIMDQIK